MEKPYPPTGCFIINTTRIEDVPTKDETTLQNLHRLFPYFYYSLPNHSKSHYKILFKVEDLM